MCRVFAGDYSGMTEVVCPDNAGVRIAGEHGERRRPPSGVKPEVVGGEEEERLRRVTIAGVDLLGVIASRPSRDDEHLGVKVT